MPPSPVDPALYAAICAADAQLRPAIPETPLLSWPAESRRSGGAVALKAEHRQVTGSFKLRGATFAVQRAPVDAPRIVTASSGNHGLAVAHALRATRRDGVIYLPTTVAPVKRAAIEATGVTIVLHGEDSGDTEHEARRVAAAEGWHYISPYNDPDVVAGQGTVGLELLRQLPQLDEVYVSVGGGGLIAGVATAIKATHPHIRIIGCAPEQSRVMLESVRAGRMLDLASGPTFSDGTAGGVEADTITFAPCRTLVDAWVAVPERAIAVAVRDGIDELHELLEGAAGVAIAALRATAATDHASGRVRVAIACGANIGSTRLRELLDAAV